VIKKLASFIFHSLGWKAVGEIPTEIKKYIIIAAPHTSNWDFFYGRLFFLMKGIPLKFFIKKEWYVFPFNYLFKSLGGIPVNRHRNENLTDQMESIFDQYEELAVLISPEGTRSYNPNWKKGFYYIAKKTKTPIILGYIDYQNKIGGFGPVFLTTSNAEADIEKIKEFYINIKGKIPENGVR
jgi:1-acyl-sn-glycerol-3-phosphate acyltransferase